MVVTTCGVLVAAPPELAGTASLDLSEGTVSSAEIGACVQVEGYDLGRLTSGVAYTDNLANLESTSLPVPAPAAAL